MFLEIHAHSAVKAEVVIGLSYNGSLFLVPLMLIHLRFTTFPPHPHPQARSSHLRGQSPIRRRADSPIRQFSSPYDSQSIIQNYNLSNS